MDSGVYMSSSSTPHPPIIISSSTMSDTANGEQLQDSRNIQDLHTEVLQCPSPDIAQVHFGGNFGGNFGGDFGSQTGRGGRRNVQRKPPREPRAHQQDHWSELQELRAKLAEHEEAMGKLKAAFGMIAIALDIQPAVHMPEYGGPGNTDMPANRPPRLSRRGGVSCVNTSQYKNYNRGGAHNFSGGYRGHMGNAPGFRSAF